jgi:hypothetical protein
MNIVRFPRPKGFFALVTAAVAGFVLSFLIFYVVTYMMWPQAKPIVNFRGQLLAGGPTSVESFPTTVGIIANATPSHSPIVGAVNSYLWWIGTGLGAVIAALFVLASLNHMGMLTYYLPGRPVSRYSGMTLEQAKQAREG